LASFAAKRDYPWRLSCFAQRPSSKFSKAFPQIPEGHPFLTRPASNTTKFSNDEILTAEIFGRVDKI
jgi:hypothetical protein